MKKAFFILATAFAAIAYGQTFAQTSTVNPGDDIPSKNVTLQNVNGKPTSLASAMGENGLLVMFSCNTCPFVVKNQPITKKTIEYAKSHHIGMVILNSNEAQRSDADSRDAMKTYSSAQGYTVPYLIDENSKLADQFGANHTPEIFLFNKSGKLVYKGAMNDNPGDPSSYKKMYIEDAISNMIAGKTIDPQTTKSIGCSIKRKA